MSTAKKRVAIVGAGPAGLVAGHKLLQTGKLSITIFEKGHQVGGLWAADSLINPEMRANSSMFTAAFSDLAWEESVDLNGQAVPMYPKAWMLERYLQEYARRYITSGQEEGEQRLVFRTHVTSAARAAGKWKIITVTTDNNQEVENVEHFDYLVLASGYLSDPKPLNCHIDPRACSVPIMHSTKYRHFHQLRLDDVNQGPSTAPRRVLVVGGSHSGSDIATLVAWQASNERWAPRKSGTSSPVEIIHITTHQLYAIPVFLRDTETACAVQPLENKIFDRASRGTDPISHTFALQTLQYSKIHRTILGGFVDGSTENSATDSNELPPYCVVSETYNQIVRNKVVRPVIGNLQRLQKTDEDSEGTLTATVVLPSGEDVHFEAISAVINATGFSSRTSLSFLAPDVRTELGFDPSDSKLPLVLDDSYLCQRSGVPDIALLGFNTFISSWGILEMEARAIAAKWAANEPRIPSVATQNECKAIADYIHAIRDAIRDGRRTEVPPIPFGDYIGLMEQAGRELCLERIDLEYSKTEGCICAARWVDSEAGKVEAQKTMARLQDIQRRARDEHLFLARSVFHGLAGKWIAEREYLDGVELTRDIEMHPRYPTSPEFHFEYVAIETSTEVSAAGEHKEEKRTILRYTEHSDEISAWDVDPRDGLSAREEPTYKLQFGRTEADDFDSCSATAIARTSNVAKVDAFPAYRFCFKGTMLKSIHMRRNGEVVVFSEPSPESVPKTNAMEVAKTLTIGVNEHPSVIAAGTPLGTC